MHGDPALMQSGDFSFQNAGAGAPPSLTATIQMSGAIIADSGAAQTRVRFDCTSVMTMQMGSTAPPTINATGTMTWESPLGTLIRTSPCGPTK
jgi:hypothetical protein